MTCSGSLHISPKELDTLRDHPGSPVAIAVNFPAAFSSRPVVILGLSGFDGGGEPFTFHLEPANITETGFDVRLRARRSWINSLYVSWLATDA